MGLLKDQLVLKFRASILSGEWRAGDVLPSRAVLAQKLGVGVNTVRAALAVLTAEGLVRVRPHIGCEVVLRSQRRLSGRILQILVGPDGAYYQTIFNGVFRDTVSAAGFRYSQVSLRESRNLRQNHRWLANELATRPDVCFVLGHEKPLPQALRLLEHFGIPYIPMDCEVDVKMRNRHCLAVAHGNLDLALNEFVADCVRAKVFSVCQFNFGVPWNIDVCARLERHGINCETVNADDGEPLQSLGDYMAAGRRAMLRRLQAGMLPDLFLFSDDYLAIGAFQGMNERGIHFPEHVSVVTFSVRGFEYPSSVSLARIEYNPYEDARMIAEALVTWCRTSHCENELLWKSSYIRGNSFPVR